jgi:hypothetical protein
MHRGQQSGRFPACAYSLGRASCMRFVCMCSQSNVPVINERFHPSIRFQTLVASATDTDTNTHAILDTNQHSTLSPSPSLPPNISHPPQPTSPFSQKPHPSPRRPGVTLQLLPVRTTNPRQRRETNGDLSLTSDRATCIRATPTQGTHHPIPATAPITTPGRHHRNVSTVLSDCHPLASLASLASAQPPVVSPGRPRLCDGHAQQGTMH